MVNPDDLQIGLVRRGHLGEVGRFLPTWSAPLRPDVDHHRLRRSPASRTARPPPRHGKTRHRGSPDETAATFGSDAGQSAMSAAFFMAARSAVDSGLRYAPRSATPMRRARPVEHAGDPLQPASTNHRGAPRLAASQPRPLRHIIAQISDQLRTFRPSGRRLWDAEFPTSCGLFELLRAPPLDVEFPDQGGFSTASLGVIRAARSRHLHPRGSRTSLAALTGSVSPSPYAGHKRATGQAPHAGFRA
mgnify:CR=1 FL=1